VTPECGESKIYNNKKKKNQYQQAFILGVKFNGLVSSYFSLFGIKGCTKKKS